MPDADGPRHRSFRVLTVAVTGGIGSGKSTVATLLADRGAVVIDSDVLAREVVAPGTAGLAAVTEQFGPGVLAADGSLDRAGMARLVFADPAARARLEAIVHPLVRAAFEDARVAAGPGAIVVNDIPLVRTLADAARYHLVVGVGAPQEVRIRRLAGRGMPEADARARMVSQIGDDARRELADVWIDNAGSETALRSTVRALWSERLVPFQDNLLTGRRAGRGGVELVASRPDWPVLARLLCARVSAATGGLRCDHIGSTAVSGLDAKDVIDLQLAVPDLSAADDLEPALAAAGFPRVEGINRDHPHPEGDAPRPGGTYPAGTADRSAADDRGLAGWRKRLHASADPDRAVNLHLRASGAPNWRWALLFRDWLRTEPAVRDEYLAVKRDLAARFAHDRTTADYAEAKESWLASAAERMEGWAQRTGWLISASAG